MNKKKLFLNLIAYSGTITPLLKFTPYWVILSLFYPASLRSYISFLTLVATAIIFSLANIDFLHLSYTIFFIYTITIGYSIIGKIKLEDIYNVFNKFLSFQAASSLIFQIAPIELIFLIRKIFVNSYYLESPEILRAAGILPEPSDHYIIPILVITISIILRKKIPLIRLMIIALCVQSLSLAILLPVLLIGTLTGVSSLQSFHKVLWLIVGFVFVTILFATLYSTSSELDPSDVSRLIWVSVAINSIFDYSLPIMNFSSENYISLIPAALNQFAGVLLERESLLTVPNSPGAYLLIFFRQIGLIIFMYFLINLILKKQSTREYLASVYTFLILFFIQSPVLIPFWILLYARRPLNNNMQS